MPQVEELSSLSLSLGRTGKKRKKMKSQWNIRNKKADDTASQKGLVLYKQGTLETVTQHKTKEGIINI